MGSAATSLCSPSKDHTRHVFCSHHCSYRSRVGNLKTVQKIDYPCSTGHNIQVVHRKMLYLLYCILLTILLWHYLERRKWLHIRVGEICSGLPDEALGFIMPTAYSVCVSTVVSTPVHLVRSTFEKLRKSRVKKWKEPTVFSSTIGQTEGPNCIPDSPSEASSVDVENKQLRERHCFRVANSRPVFIRKSVGYIVPIFHRATISAVVSAPAPLLSGTSVVLGNSRVVRRKEQTTVSSPKADPQGNYCIADGDSEISSVVVDDKEPRDRHSSAATYGCSALTCEEIGFIMPTAYSASIATVVSAPVHRLRSTFAVLANSSVIKRNEEDFAGIKVEKGNSLRLERKAYLPPESASLHVSMCLYGTRAQGDVEGLCVSTEVNPRKEPAKIATVGRKGGRRTSRIRDRFRSIRRLFGCCFGNT